MIIEQDELSLRRRMLQCGGAILSVEGCSQHSAKQKILSGWFAVDHSENADRRILDRRTANHGELHLKWLVLPWGSMLNRLCSGPREGVRGSGHDLLTYFMQLREHPSGISRQGAGGAFLGDDFTEFGAVPAQLYVFALASLGMGDVNATDTYQEVHFEVPTSLRRDILPELETTLTPESRRSLCVHRR